MSARVIDLLALRLLGRHVFERADHRSGRGLRGALLHRSRDAEVHDQRVAAVGGLALLDHDVLGLEVAMDHALVVRGGEALRHLLRDQERPRDRQRRRARSTWASVSPSTNGIVRYLMPSISPRS